MAQKLQANPFNARRNAFFHQRCMETNSMADSLVFMLGESPDPTMTLTDITQLAADPSGYGLTKEDGNRVNIIQIAQTARKNGWVTILADEKKIWSRGQVRLELTEAGRQYFGELEKKLREYLGNPEIIRDDARDFLLQKKKPARGITSESTGTQVGCVVSPPSDDAPFQALLRELGSPKPCERS